MTIADKYQLVFFTGKWGKVYFYRTIIMFNLNQLLWHLIFGILELK